MDVRHQRPARDRGPGLRLAADHGHRDREAAAAGQARASCSPAGRSAPSPTPARSCPTARPRWTLAIVLVVAAGGAVRRRHAGTCCARRRRSSTCARCASRPSGGHQRQLDVLARGRARSRSCCRCCSRPSSGGARSSRAASCSSSSSATSPSSRRPRGSSTASAFAPCCWRPRPAWPRRPSPPGLLTADTPVVVVGPRGGAERRRALGRAHGLHDARPQRRPTRADARRQRPGLDGPAALLGTRGGGGDRRPAHRRRARRPAARAAPARTPPSPWPSSCSPWRRWSAPSTRCACTPARARRSSRRRRALVVVAGLAGQQEPRRLALGDDARLRPGRPRARGRSRAARRRSRSRASCSRCLIVGKTSAISPRSWASSAARGREPAAGRRISSPSIVAAPGRRAAAPGRSACRSGSRPRRGVIQRENFTSAPGSSTRDRRPPPRARARPRRGAPRRPRPRRRRPRRRGRPTRRP